MQCTKKECTGLRSLLAIVKDCERELLPCMKPCSPPISLFRIVVKACHLSCRLMQGLLHGFLSRYSAISRFGQITRSQLSFRKCFWIQTCPAAASFLDQTDGLPSGCPPIELPHRSTRRNIDLVSIQALISLLFQGGDWTTDENNMSPVFGRRLGAVDVYSEARHKRGRWIFGSASISSIFDAKVHGQGTPSTIRPILSPARPELPRRQSVYLIRPCKTYRIEEAQV